MTILLSELFWSAVPLNIDDLKQVLCSQTLPLIVSVSGLESLGPSFLKIIKR